MNVSNRHANPPLEHAPRDLHLMEQRETADTTTTINTTTDVLEIGRPFAGFPLEVWAIIASGWDIAAADHYVVYACVARIARGVADYVGPSRRAEFMDAAGVKVYLRGSEVVKAKCMTTVEPIIGSGAMVPMDNAPVYRLAHVWIIEEWTLRNLRHDVFGPAVVRSNGTREWWARGKRHRDGAPAIMSAQHISWWQHGKRHRPRDEGPAHYDAKGQVLYYEFGMQVDIAPSPVHKRQARDELLEERRQIRYKQWLRKWM